ncbi:MAG: PilZ domain-containing protein [Legionellales bacterium]
MTEELPLITCSFLTETLLYSAYMPFIKGGGLFVRTNNTYSLGTKVQLSVTLIDEHEPYLVSGNVAWITPKGAQNNKPSGVGIQFLGESSRFLSNKIETYLAGMLKLSQLNDTI